VFENRPYPLESPLPGFNRRCRGSVLQKRKQLVESSEFFLARFLAGIIAAEASCVKQLRDLNIGQGSMVSVDKQVVEFHHQKISR
jgi:hypothetical protein